MDLVQRRPLEPYRGRVLSELADWLAATLGAWPKDLASYERALTHGSRGPASYERLEFLGDRVLGLAVAEWLYAEFPHEPEGQLSKRLNALVTGAVCAAVARELDVPTHLRLGKQARDDGATDSDNVLGDVLEALLGALYLDHGLAAACAFVRARWAERLRGETVAPQHPKSALQEWAAAHRRKPPAYEVIDRAGSGHAPRFTVRVRVGNSHEATATGGSKQEAETAAAAALLAELSPP